MFFFFVLMNKQKRAFSSTQIILSMKKIYLLMKHIHLISLNSKHAAFKTADKTEAAFPSLKHTHEHTHNF